MSQSSSTGNSSSLLLDACALINLYACGYADEILASSSATFAIVSHVQDETLFIRRGGTGQDARDRVSIDLDVHLSRGLLPDCAQRDRRGADHLHRLRCGSW